MSHSICSVAERAHVLALVLQHVDERDEVHAVVVEALPPGPAVGEAAEVLLAAVDEHVVLAGHVEDLPAFTPLSISLTVSNAPGFCPCVRSPVCMTKAGAGGSALILSTTCCSVTAASLFASPLKPTCVSLIWTKLKLPGRVSAAAAGSTRDENMPPEAVQTTPIPPRPCTREIRDDPFDPWLSSSGTA